MVVATQEYIYVIDALRCNNTPHTTFQFFSIYALQIELDTAKVS